MTKLRICWKSLIDAQTGKTRWISGDIMPKDVLHACFDAWQFKYGAYDFWLEKAVVDDPLLIEQASVEKVEVLSEREKKHYQRLI